jgi:FMN phosphatase YigB (HAD superfamily)
MKEKIGWGEIHPPAEHPTTVKAKLRFVLFDWGDTLMSEVGPVDIPMADWEQVRVIGGASEVLSLLSPKYRIAIATNATVSKKLDVARALERAGLKRFVDKIFCSTELGHKKSEPEFWDAVLAQLGAQKDELIMIGDSLEQDVLGPMRAGIRAIWFNWKQESYWGAPSIQSIHALRELSAVIEGFT